MERSKTIINKLVELLNILDKMYVKHLWKAFVYLLACLKVNLLCCFMPHEALPAYKLIPRGQTLIDHSLL